MTAPEPVDDACPWLGLVGFGMLAAAVSLLLSLWLFPHSSPIFDERVYRQQASALVEGELTLPVSFGTFHDPFFTGPRPDGRLIFVYPHSWPAVLALSSILTGTARTAVPLVALAGTIGVGVFAYELTRRRRIALLASALMVVCPLFEVLAAARLAYAMGTALLAWALVYLVRTQRSLTIPAAVGAGFFGGWAFYHRPYDAVIVLTPAVLWCGWQVRHRWRQLAPPIAGMGAGALLPLGIYAWTNLRITGSPRRLPYTTVGPRNIPGYGLRIDTLGTPPIDFTPAKGFEVLQRGAVGLLTWLPLGPVSIVLLVAGIWLLRRRGGGLLALLVAAPLVGYLFYWGAYSGYVRFNTIAMVGPMYHLAVVIPVAVAGGVALDRLLGLRARRTIAVGAVVGVAIASLVLVPTVDRLVDYRTDFGRTVAFVDRLGQQGQDAAPTPGGGALVIAGTDPLLIEWPLYNQVDLDGPVVGARDVEGRLVELLERFPERGAVIAERRYVLPGRPGEIEWTDGYGFDRDDVGLVLTRVSAPTIDLDVALTADLDADSLLYVRSANDVVGVPAAGAGHTVTVSAGAVLIDGSPGEPFANDLDTTVSGVLCIGLLQRTPDGAASARDEVCFEVADRSTGPTVVSPGRQRTLFPYGKASMLAADVSDRLVVTVSSDTPRGAGG